MLNEVGIEPPSPNLPGGSLIKTGDAVRLSVAWTVVRKARRDLLPAESLRCLEAAVREVRAVVSSAARGQEIGTALDQLRRKAEQHLRPYPHPRWRENVEVFLVTAAVVLALRTFFFQPMAIPSGSAQPTLWGITQENLIGRPDVQIPGGLRRFLMSWWSGESYFQRVARAGGTLRVSKPRLVFPFIRMQVLRVGRETHRLFYSSSLEDLAQRAGLRDGQSVQAGQDLIRLRVTSGDHLFINRLIYNFRPPRRGETIVFHTHEYLVGRASFVFWPISSRFGWGYR